MYNTYPMSEYFSHPAYADFIRDSDMIVCQPTEDTTLRFAVESEVSVHDFSAGIPHWEQSIPLTEHSQFPGVIPEHLSLATISKLLQKLRGPMLADARNYLMEIEESGEILPLAHGYIDQPYVYHGGAAIFESPTGNTSACDAMREYGHYGAQDGITYFSKDPLTALLHGLGHTQRAREEDTRVLLLTIDITKLEKLRNIFIDPESVLPSLAANEFGQNFVVHNGIPVYAIERAEVLRQLS